jgi:hypothetical protein
MEVLEAETNKAIFGARRALPKPLNLGDDGG